MCLDGACNWCHDSCICCKIICVCWGCLGVWSHDEAIIQSLVKHQQLQVQSCKGHVTLMTAEPSFMSEEMDDKLHSTDIADQ